MPLFSSITAAPELRELQLQSQLKELRRAAQTEAIQTAETVR
jgi:hypothetical protein